MTHLRSHRIHVQLAQRDRSTFLALVSVLHRRGVEVVAAELCPSDAGDAFTASFLATWAQARTVRATLCNLIHVLHAELVQDAEHFTGAATVHDAAYVQPVQLPGAAR